MSKVLIPLAQGCEELEAVTLIDVLRRAGIGVTTAGLAEGPVTGSRKTVLLPDTTLEKVLGEDFDMIVLPGGLPGSEHLQNDERIIGLLKKMNENGQYTGAICAAPRALARAGLLKGKRATAYPGALASLELPDTRVTTEPVTRDGTVLTSRSVGTAMDFALAIVETLEGRPKRDEVERAMER